MQMKMISRLPPLPTILLPCITMSSNVSDNSGGFQRKDLYLRLEHLIQTNDIDAMKKHIQDENLTHADFAQYSEEWLRGTDPLPSYPIAAAVKCGNVDIMNFFISIGFQKNYSGRLIKGNPLTEACCKGHLHVVRELIEVHEVDINSVSRSEKGPLIEAILARQLEIVQYLLEKGAKVPDHKMCRAPIYAAVFGVKHVQVVQLLLPHVDVNVAVWPRYETALFNAAAFAGEEIVKTLLDAGADVEGNEKAKFSPFFYALYCGKIENARLLYSRGANPNTIKRLQKNYPLESILKSVKYEVIHYLVVELNLPWDDDNMPLELSIQLNRVKTSTIKLLADSGLIYNGSVPVVPYCCRGEVKAETDMILEHLSSNPRTLKQIICFKVRRLLTRNLSRVVDSLPLPRPLIDFVKLTHIPCHETGYNDNI